MKHTLYRVVKDGKYLCPRIEPDRWQEGTSNSMIWHSKDRATEVALGCKATVEAFEVDDKEEV